MQLLGTAYDIDLLSELSNGVLPQNSPELFLTVFQHKNSPMVISKIKDKLSNPYIRNAGWLGAAELANRFFRLGTTVVLARTFTPQDYGLVAIIITVNEFANAFVGKAGISSKLVQAAEEDLDVLCNTAYWMSWIASGAIFLLQCLASVLIGLFYQDHRIILPICVLALGHFVIPLFTVHISLIERENRLKIIALCNATQVFLMNILTISLALLGLGIWSIVLSMILTVPVWAIIGQLNCSWRVGKSFTLYRWKEIAKYAVNIVGSDLLVKLRDNLDYLLVGRFLGIEMLGVYFFAFNAGLGISLSIINSLTWSLWPHLCDARSNLSDLKIRYYDGLKTIATVIIPLVFLQSSLAPFYVPIVFGDRWVFAIPILITICLSAIPRPFFIATTHLLNAVDKTNSSFRWSIGLTFLYLFLLLVAVQYNIFVVALSVLISQFLFTPVYMLWARRNVFYTVASQSCETHDENWPLR